ncbi:MAG: hypothetical protein MUC92_05955 [Fimbriimonadaceae bacterium]|jgi:hypothetical protein|nr:hypothetical protein [Fimbriimonadaceae bacterium]
MNRFWKSYALEFDEIDAAVSDIEAENKAATLDAASFREIVSELQPFIAPVEASNVRPYARLGPIIYKSTPKISDNWIFCHESNSNGMVVSKTVADVMLAAGLTGFDFVQAQTNDGPIDWYELARVQHIQLECVPEETFSCPLCGQAGIYGQWIVRPVETKQEPSIFRPWGSARLLCNDQFYDLYMSQKWRGLHFGIP